MFPILLDWGPITVRSYGVFMALAFLAGISLVKRGIRVQRLPEGPVLNLSVMLVVTGLLGARLFYVLTNLSYFRDHPIAAFKLWEGGLVFYGGFVVAAIVGWITIKRWHLRFPIAVLADIFAPALILGQAIGRWGCFFAGCCYGRPTGEAWGVRFTNPDALGPLNLMLHPIQIYESIGCFVILAILVFRQGQIRRKGGLFWLYVILYATLRFVLEFWRGDDRGPFVGFFSPSQLIALVAISVGLFVVGFQRSSPPLEKPHANPS